MKKPSVRKVTDREKDRPLYEPTHRLHKVRAMLNTAEGASLYDIAERLNICRRTALRYLQEIQSEGNVLSDDLDGKRKIWRLMSTSRSQSITFTTTQMLALSLSRRVFDFLAGTGFKEDLDEVFETVEATLKRKDFVHAKNLDRKLFDRNETPHIYEGRIEHMNDIMTALLSEERLRVTHGSVLKWEKKFLFSPYTLVVYQKGLYLAGYSDYHQAIRTFSLDGFRAVDHLRGKKFEYPADYDPAQLFGKSFGLSTGERTRVRIRFDHGVARFVRRRRWHASQQLKQVGHDLELTMDIAVTFEVFNWIMGYGHKAEVLEPEKLRDDIAAAHQKAADRYRSKSAD